MLSTLLLAVALASTAPTTVPTTASAAAPIRECGHLSSAYAGNITTRKVSCAEARRVVRAWNRGPAQGRGNRARGLRCRYRDVRHELGDIRCTGSRGGVVRWQTGV
ncbi:MAG: hypothetical protein M0P31_06520 [Solirubrobacteraceae bacterium]|nr:hypothetical protein [Solirubrobacteraceae bacterium]